MYGLTFKYCFRPNSSHKCHISSLKNMSDIFQPYVGQFPTLKKVNVGQIPFKHFTTLCVGQIQCPPNEPCFLHQRYFFLVGYGRKSYKSGRGPKRRCSDTRKRNWEYLTEHLTKFRARKSTDIELYVVQKRR